MTRWPIWRLLVWLELWMFAVAAAHAFRPLHEAFVVPLLIAFVPAALVVAMWALSRGATAERPHGAERASWLELLVAGVAVIASAGWVMKWTIGAHQDLQRIDAMLGEATLIVDVSLTWLSIGACLAALTLDGLLATVHDQLRDTMQWLRRTHVVVTVLQVLGLFGSAWLFTQLPDTGTADNAAFFGRARMALHVYEYSRATVFPVQAFFAAMALAIATADTRAGRGVVRR